MGKVKEMQMDYEHAISKIADIVHTYGPITINIPGDKVLIIQKVEIAAGEDEGRGYSEGLHMHIRSLACNCGYDETWQLGIWEGDFDSNSMEWLREPQPTNLNVKVADWDYMEIMFTIIQIGKLIED